jgi:hypothetical protein
MKFAATHEVDRLCGRRTETKMNGYRSVLKRGTLLPFSWGRARGRGQSYDRSCTAADQPTEGGRGRLQGMTRTSQGCITHRRAPTSTDRILGRS